MRLAFDLLPGPYAKFGPDAFDSLVRTRTDIVVRMHGVASVAF